MTITEIITIAVSAAMSLIVGGFLRHVSKAFKHIRGDFQTLKDAQRDSLRYQIVQAHDYLYRMGASGSIPLIASRTCMQAITSWAETALSLVLWRRFAPCRKNRRSVVKMQGIILILALAVVVEAVVEYIKSIGKMFATGDWKTAVTQLSAAAIAIALCFAAGADLFAALGLHFGLWWIGVVLTGLFASRGANYVSDIIRKLQSLGKPKAE